MTSWRGAAWSRSADGFLPASPQQNGAHERMHRTLKVATARPPQSHMGTQQRAFSRFRVVYNEERPHQFLEGRTPASVYQMGKKMEDFQATRIFVPVLREFSE